MTPARLRFDAPAASDQGGIAFTDWPEAIDAAAAEPGSPLDTPRPTARRPNWTSVRKRQGVAAATARLGAAVSTQVCLPRPSVIADAIAFAPGEYPPDDEVDQDLLGALFGEMQRLYDVRNTPEAIVCFAIMFCGENRGVTWGEMRAHLPHAAEIASMFAGHGVLEGFYEVMDSGCERLFEGEAYDRAFVAIRSALATADAKAALDLLVSVLTHHRTQAVVGAAAAQPAVTQEAAAQPAVDTQEAAAQPAVDTQEAAQPAVDTQEAAQRKPVQRKPAQRKPARRKPARRKPAASHAKAKSRERWQELSDWEPKDIAPRLMATLSSKRDRSGARCALYYAYFDYVKGGGATDAAPLEVVQRAVALFPDFAEAWEKREKLSGGDANLLSDMPCRCDLEMMQIMTTQLVQQLASRHALRGLFSQ